jgi:hypothetical protein
VNKLSDSKEKRKHPGVETDKFVAFRVDGEPGATTGMVFNASQRGLLVGAFRDIPVGTRIVIEVTPPKGFNVAKRCAIAEIIWKDICLWDDWEGYKYRIKFIRSSNKSHPEVKHVEPNQGGQRGKSLANKSGHNELLIIEGERHETK